MSPGHRLWLLPLLIASCAHQQLVVPESDWEKVPAPQRAAIDRKHEADLVSARAELKAATTGLAEVQRPPAPASGTAGAMAKPDPDADPWALAIYDHDQSRASARTRVQDALTAWQRMRLTWRQRQLDAATARVDMVVSDRELTRARAIDHTLPGDEHYDSAPLQGQFSTAQRRWYAAATAARAARVELERASTTLASAKEAYAQLMRNGPVHLAMQLPGDSDDRPRLELTAWTVTRSDIGRRKGLRHLLDAAASGTPQLRKRDFQLRPMPTPRAPANETSRAAAPLVAPAAAPRTPPAPSAEPARPPGATSSLAPAPKPWDFVEPAAPAARPAAARPTAASAVATRTRKSPAAPPAPKPWDFIEPAAAPAPPTAIARPAVAARTQSRPSAPPAPKPWDFIEPAVPPAPRR
ncbi:MAG TPA: hypothetical protein VLM79_12640 [Kofleriaceae bacterium]|nr:hypothetical protein [Kofleriaceae bacterium]